MGRIDEHGRVVIPAALRVALSVRAPAPVTFEVVEGGVVVRPHAPECVSRVSQADVVFGLGGGCRARPGSEDAANADGV